LNYSLVGLALELDRSHTCLSRVDEVAKGEDRSIEVHRGVTSVHHAGNLALIAELLGVLGAQFGADGALECYGLHGLENRDLEQKVVADGLVGLDFAHHRSENWCYAEGADFWTVPLQRYGVSDDKFVEGRGFNTLNRVA